ncbi:MAG: hypothetical protein RMK91_00880 [Pseudanabaenaceae cyanobacterium SKYGB_i_bin29]|nr:hypothetical protein [Pseudanabaenaceae cyanobacterium SKYG29]MDW8420406.1 hypothetical protein [Pseudanabaenaceae cyanobacterium SKYGB_i_bin29]
MNNKLQEKLGHWGQQFVLFLRRFLSKINPTLAQWQQQLSPGEPSEGWQQKLRAILASFLAQVLNLTQKWQAEPDDQPLLPPQVQQELGTAWEFTRTKVFPRIVSFFQWLVDSLDPKLQQFYTWLGSQKPLTDWQASPLYARVLTAVTPIDRFIQTGAPEPLKPIVAKRSATYTLVILLLLFLLFKPSGQKAVAVTKAKSLPVAVDAPVRGKGVIPPDRILVSDVQNQVAKIAQLFGEGLIHSVQANYKLGKLVVLVTDDWYQLTPFQQDQMMDNLLEQSVTLGFKKLYLADTHQTIIARNPDVGIKMVVLNRQPR